MTTLVCCPHCNSTHPAANARQFSIPCPVCGRDALLLSVSVSSDPSHNNAPVSVSFTLVFPHQPLPAFIAAQRSAHSLPLAFHSAYRTLLSRLSSFCSRHNIPTPSLPPLSTILHYT